MYSKRLIANGIRRKINVYVGDMTKTDQYYDLILCSAFKGIYDVEHVSLVQSLYLAGINVNELSQHPEKNGKDFGFWISEKTNAPFFDRLCCFEFMHAFFYGAGTSFREVFDYFITMLTYDKQFNFKSIASTLLGTNHIGLSKKQIIPILLQTVLQCFLTNNHLVDFSIYCKHEDEAKMINDVLKTILKKTYDVFISYPHAREKDMNDISLSMKKHELITWSDKRLKGGDEFDDIIAKAIDDSEIFFLIWSEETEESSYCIKELEYALDLNKKIIPLRCSQKLNGGTIIGKKIGRRNWLDYDKCSFESLTQNVKSVLLEIKETNKTNIVEE